jgi:hypothetical protein
MLPIGTPGSADLGSKHHRKAGLIHPYYVKNKNSEPAAEQCKVYDCQLGRKVCALQGSRDD